MGNAQGLLFHSCLPKLAPKAPQAFSKNDRPLEASKADCDLCKHMYLGMELGMDLSMKVGE